METKSAEISVGTDSSSFGGFSTNPDRSDYSRQLAASLKSESKLAQQTGGDEFDRPVVFPAQTGAEKFDKPAVMKEVLISCNMDADTRTEMGTDYQQPYQPRETTPEEDKKLQMLMLKTLAQELRRDQPIKQIKKPSVEAEREVESFVKSALEELRKKEFVPRSEEETKEVASRILCDDDEIIPPEGVPWERQGPVEG